MPCVERFDAKLNPVGVMRCDGVAAEISLYRGTSLIRNTPLLGIYPLFAKMLEPLARFVRKLPKDSNLAEDGFPGLINQELLGSFCTDYSICSAQRI